MENIDKLTADLNAATEQVAALQLENAELKALIEKQETLQRENDELLAKVAALEALVPSAGNSAKIVAKAEPAKEPPTFTLGKKKYRFKAGGFNLGEGGVLATNAVKDQELLKRIVDDYPGLIEEI